MEDENQHDAVADDPAIEGEDSIAQDDHRHGCDGMETDNNPDKAAVSKGFPPPATPPGTQQDGDSEADDPEAPLGDHSARNSVKRKPSADGICVRYTRKKRGCVNCGGPCGDVCIENGEQDDFDLEYELGRLIDTSTTQVEADDGKGIEEDESEDEAVAAFRRAVERSRLEKRARSQIAEAPIHTNPSNLTSTGQARKKARTNPRIQKPQLPPYYGQVPIWMQGNPTVGGVQIHTTHARHLGYHRGLVWCWHCGRYATAVHIHLRRACGNPTDGGLSTLARLRNGKPPWSATWPLPVHF